MKLSQYYLNISDYERKKSQKWKNDGMIKNNLEKY